MSAKAKILDFSGVEDKSSFRPRRKPEGDYYARIVAVDDHASKDNDGWVFTIKVNGDARATYPYYCMFGDNQLWKIRNLVAAVGLKAPGSRVKIDPAKLVGKDIGVALADDEYEGRVKSTIDAVFPVDDIEDARNETGSASSTKAKAKSRKAEEEDDDEDDEDDEPAPRKSSKKRQPEPDEDEDDDDEEKPKKRASSKKSKSRDEDEDEDEDDEEEPKSKKKAAPAKPKSKKKSRDDDDDEDELDLDDL